MSAPPTRGGPFPARLPALLLASLAVSLGGVAGLGLVADAYSPPVWMLVEHGLTLLLPATLVYGAYWLATGEFTADELWRTLWWTVGGVVLLAVVAAFVLLHRRFEGAALVEPVFLVALLSLTGGVVGFAAAVAQLHATRMMEPPESAPESESADSSVESEPADDSSADSELAEGSQRSRSEADGSCDAGPEAHSDRDVGGPEFLRSRTREQSLTRQWTLLEAVASHDECSIDELASTLARDPRNSFANDPERVRIRLYHHYVPSVAETGLVEFDPASERVRYEGPETFTS